MIKSSKTRREFLKTTLAGGAALTAGISLMGESACRNEKPQQPATGPGPLPQPLDPSNVTLRGELGNRLQTATYNVLARPERYPLESFASSASSKPGALWYDWPGDQIGRFLSVLHLAEGYGWTPAAAKRAAIGDVILPLQTPEGNFGAPGTAKSNDVKILSGNAFALRGLMDAYSDTKEPRYLEGGRRLARFFESIAPAWETKRDGKLHEFYGHCLDGLVALYELAGDSWALDLARRLASHAGRTSHTHHSLSLCRGLVDLGRLTCEKAYMDRVEDFLAYCRESMAVTGGHPESLPAYNEDEGCALSDWVVVNLLMFQGTGEERYLDAAEHTLVNHFSFNQFVTGGFGHRSFAQDIVGGKDWQGWEGKFGSENPGCCSMWGAWGLGQVGRYVIMSSGDDVLVNLYAPADVDLPERGIHITMTSDYPGMSRARLHVCTEGDGRFALGLRIPPWAGGIEVTRAGKPVSHASSGRRLNLDGPWKNGETVDIHFKSGLRLVSWPAKDKPGFGVFDGPLCFGLPDSAADVSLAWAVLADAAGHPVLDRQGRPQLAEPSGRMTTGLAPISSDWQYPDVHKPRRWRVLFARKATA